MHMITFLFPEYEDAEHTCGYLAYSLHFIQEQGSFVGKIQTIPGWLPSARPGKTPSSY